MKIKNLKTMNKKASMPLPTTVLVIMVLMLTSTSLFLFASSTGKIKEEISNHKMVDELVYSDNLARFYLSESGEKAIQESLKEIFQDTGKSMENNFKEVFKKNFKKEMLSKKEEILLVHNKDKGRYFPRFYEEIENNEFEIKYNYEENKVSIEVQDFKSWIILKTKREEGFGEWTTDIVVEFDLDTFNLDDD
ncbi:MAG: hypothetical protein ACOCUU_01505 [Nanoarchaeota archaeon]